MRDLLLLLAENFSEDVGRGINSLFFGYQGYYRPFHMIWYCDNFTLKETKYRCSCAQSLISLYEECL